LGASDIDVAKLPQRALFDTTIVIRALGDRPDDPRSPACEALWEAMLQNGRQILVAAPTIAEMARKEGGAKRSLPRRKGVEVVAFDDLAAELLGRSMPNTVLQTAKEQTKLPRDYIKYDALIIACAARHRATHIITLDDGMTGLATKVGLSIGRPEDYLTAQATLPNVR
jgi:predicted nucleic acid-binding protein